MAEQRRGGKGQRKELRSQKEEGRRYRGRKGEEEALQESTDITNEQFTVAASEWGQRCGTIHLERSIVGTNTQISCIHRINRDFPAVQYAIIWCKEQ